MLLVQLFIKRRFVKRNCSIFFFHKLGCVQNRVRNSNSLAFFLTNAMIIRFAKGPGIESPYEFKVHGTVHC
jgi:hypothetical protein